MTASGPESTSWGRDLMRNVYVTISPAIVALPVGSVKHLASAGRKTGRRTTTPVPAQCSQQQSTAGTPTNPDGHKWSWAEARHPGRL